MTWTKLLTFAVLLLGTTTAHAVTMQMLPVGSPANAPDSATGYGEVDYSYSIGEYDVTNVQYAEFLNAKAVTDTYGLWNSVMDPVADSGIGGITRSGSNGLYSYSVAAGYANKPVAGVSWYDAVRFVNWLQNGQGNGDTESGTYIITNGGSDSGTVTIPSASQRAAWAATGQFHWLLPSENEWYKAAYYNPVSRTYYAYPFQSNTEPTALAPPGTADSGNFLLVPQLISSGYNSDGYGSNLTDIASYVNATSPVGSYDMGGELWQLLDTAVGPAFVVRGGDWDDQTFTSAASYLTAVFPGEQDRIVGFRVASVPEPSSAALACFALGALLIIKRLRAR